VGAVAAVGRQRDGGIAFLAVGCLPPQGEDGGPPDHDQPVAAYPLVGVHEAPEQRHGARFVGREAELAFIREAWRRLSVERRCELVTILGEAGVGKSRLIREALQPLGARVVRGRCLPYGEGITYWPVAEVLRQIAAGGDRPGRTA